MVMREIWERHLCTAGVEVYSWNCGASIIKHGNSVLTIRRVAYMTVCTVHIRQIRPTSGSSGTTIGERKDTFPDFNTRLRAFGQQLDSWFEPWYQSCIGCQFSVYAGNGGQAMVR